MIYYAMYASTMQYGVKVWGGTKKIIKYFRVSEKILKNYDMFQQSKNFM